MFIARIMLICVLSFHIGNAGTSNTNGSSTNYSSADAWAGSVPNLTFWQQGSVTENVKYDLTYTETLTSTNGQQLVVYSGTYINY